MSYLPLPPALFHRRQLRTRLVDPASLVRLAWDSPTTLAGFRYNARYRFDAPDASFGVLYAAFDLKTAFVETILRNEPAQSPAGDPRILSLAELEPRRVVSFTNDFITQTRHLTLIELFAEGLVAAQTDNRISTEDSYPVTQQWAKALHGHPIRADGIVYVSRYFAPRLSVVHFDRCAAALRVGPVVELLKHADFARLVNDFNLSIAAR